MPKRFVSIDVECAAIGFSHSSSDRVPCSVAMVESGTTSVWHRLIMVQNMVSPLTYFTGMTKDQINKTVFRLRMFDYMVWSIVS